MKTVFAFVAGALVGGGIAWLYAKEKYAAQAEADISEMREFYLNRTQKDEEKTEEPRHNSNEKPDIMTFAAKLHKEGYTDYTTTSVDPNLEVGKRPYVISPDEFGLDDEYTKITLYYYIDGVIADEMDEVVDNVDETVGQDAVSHYGEYEDDCVYVRNDARRCDYEILRSLQAYSEVLKRKPYLRKAEVE